ncbi:MAG: hypothetical protein RR309_11195 [Cellulosilyticaceae bacterium]
MFRGMVVLVMSFMMVCNAMAVGKIDYKVDIKSYIGTLYNKLPEEIKALEDNKKIDMIYKEQGVITDIHIKDSKIVVDSIKIGDTLTSIAPIYPEAWMTNVEDGVIILLGKDSHYGIVTNYIAYLSEDDKTISEIRMGYTAEFTSALLPESNEEAKELLQGIWQSEKDKKIVYKKGKLSDSVFDKIYDRQEYKVIAPNEMIIYRSIKDSSEKVRLKFWVTQHELYTFAVDKLGVPIKESIEKFNKIN